jgi:hypothetical protein
MDRLLRPMRVRAKASAGRPVSVNATSCALRRQSQSPNALAMVNAMIVNTVIIMAIANRTQNVIRLGSTGRLVSSPILGPGTDVQAVTTIQDAQVIHR